MKLIFMVITMNLVKSDLLTQSLHHRNLESRIVNGEQAFDKKQFAYQASLRMPNRGHTCGAVILNENHLITAAHCVDGNKESEYEVLGGTLNIRQYARDNTSQKLRVERITIHHKYDKKGHRNDLAILRTQNRFTFSPELTRVPIWNRTNVIPKNCVVSGWGGEYNGGPTMDVLHFVQVTPYRYKDCKKFYPNDIHKGMLCAGDNGTGQDACTGDSGGPLVCDNQLYGIVSWGVDCGIPYQPGVYSNVSFYQDWIIKHTSDSSINECIMSLFLLTIILHIICWLK